MNLPEVPDNQGQLPARVPLVPERSDFLEGDSPAAEKVEAFLANALAATGGANITAGALVPWICDALLRTTRSRRTAGTSWTSSAICRLRA